LRVKNGVEKKKTPGHPMGMDPVLSGGEKLYVSRRSTAT
jgi:hypothetical protein